MTKPLLSLWQLWKLTAVVIFLVCVWLIAGYALDTAYERYQEGRTAPRQVSVVDTYVVPPQPNETQVFLNESLGYNYTPGYWNTSDITYFSTIESDNVSVVVTPAPWNDTRRESVGLPADGYKNPCCSHCTPTPTPTIPVCEFPWWCR